MPKTPEYVVNGVRVGPNGLAVKKRDVAPLVTDATVASDKHVHPADVGQPSPGEVAQAAGKTAPNPEDFDTEEDYLVAVAANEAKVFDQLTDEKRDEEGLEKDPVTGQIRRKAS